MTAAAVVCVLGLTWGVLPNAGAQSDDRKRNEREINVLTATREEVGMAMAELDERYQAQQANVDEARAAVDVALEEEQRAIARVELAKIQVALARDEVRAYAVEAYVRPPAQDELRVLSIGDVDDASYVNSVLKILSVERNKVVEILVEKQEIADREQRSADEAAERARELASEAEVQLLELDRTRAEQQSLAATLDDRLDAALAESAALAAIDRQMAEELRQQELALRDAGPPSVVQVASVSEAATNDGGAATSAPPAAAPAPAAPAAAPPAAGAPAPAPAPRPPTTRPPSAQPPSGPAPSPPSGTVTWNDVTNVGGIWVHTSIANNVRNLLNAATAAGFSLRGGGYRDSAGQIATRRNNCGTSYYDIYQKPASQCSPPTAIPGRSMHEKGLAIDFTSSGSLISSRSNPAFGWLSANASRYGLYNLPSEPWHWSTNGN